VPIAFVDKKLIEALQTIEDNDSSEPVYFPAHTFEATCLRAGITLSDLEKRTYVSIMKVLFSFLKSNKKEGTKMATQKDIDKFMS
jgi:hypothetical protein